MSNSIDTIEDLTVRDGQANFSGGQASALPPYLLAQNQCAQLINLDVLLNGEVRSRFGFHQKGDFSDYDTPVGLGFINWASGESTTQYIILVATETSTGNKHAIKIDSSYAVDSVVTLPDFGTGQADIVQVGNYVFYACRTPGTASVIASDAATATTVAGPSITKDPEHARLLATQKFRLFAAQGVDELFMTQFLPENDPTKCFESGGSAIGSVRIGAGEGDDIVSIVSWKGFQLVVLKRHSLWWVDTSEAGVHTSATTAAADFNIERISGSVGCVAPRSAVVVGNDVLFLARDGVRSVARVQADGEGKLSPPLSTPIDDLIQRINWSAVDTAAAASFDGRYYLSVPLDSSTVPNYILVFDPNLNQPAGAWLVWTDLSIIDWCVTSFTGQTPKLLALSQDDSSVPILYEFRGRPGTELAVDTDYKDYIDGSYIAPTWKMTTRAFSFGDVTAPKELSDLTVEFMGSETAVDIAVQADTRAPSIVDSAYQAGTDVLRLPFTLPQTLPDDSPYRKRAISLISEVPVGRTFQVEITRNAGIAATDPVGIRSIYLDGWRLASCEANDGYAVDR